MGSKGKTGIKRVLINIGITLLVGFVYFYIRLPAINLHNVQFYSFIFILSVVFCLLTALSMGVIKSSSDPKTIWQGLKQYCLVPLIICGLLALIYIIGSLISSPIVRASDYTKLLKIEQSSFVKDVKEISFDQIPMLDEASAMKLGDRKLGELADMVSQFEVADNYTQINYKGRPVRVTPLKYGDLIKWFNNRSNGLPAYLVIDMVTQKVDVIRLAEGMKYSDAELFNRNIYRYLRFKYPTFMFDTANFEIDDSGAPYWVCPKLEKTIGLFGGTDINGAVLVNAVTGESRYYRADEIPNWVDRVYTSELLIEQYDYYGKYVNGYLNSIFGQRGVTQTTDGYNYIAMNDDVYMYTGITSAGSDESNIGFILANQRTKQTTYYSIAGAEEYSAMYSAQGVVQDLGYKSTFPLLLNISSQPTYFMALKDGAGLVKAYAMVNVQQYQIVATGPTVEACEKNYLELLLQSGIVTEEEVERHSESGFVAEIRTAVLSGTSYYYVRLEGRGYYYAISAADCEEVVIINVGDYVTVDYTGTEGSLRPAHNIKRG